MNHPRSDNSPSTPRKSGKPAPWVFAPTPVMKPVMLKVVGIVIVEYTTPPVIVTLKVNVLVGDIVIDVVVGPTTVV
jgi:hypothetical protein